MHPQGAPSALGEHVEVAACLGGLDDTEARAVPRDRQILVVFRGDLQEHAGVRASFVSLAGRVQEARAEADAGRDLAAVAQKEA